MTSTPRVTIMPAPTAEELKTYCRELKEWKTANNVTAGVILGVLSDEVQYIIDPEDPAKSMYNKLKAEIIKQSSSSSANSTRIKLIYKQFKDAPTMESFEKHLTFYCSKNASLNAVGTGFNDSFLAWLLLNSFNTNKDPVWSMASTNIVTSDTLINQWLFNHVARKLCKALQNNIQPAETLSASTNQTVLNATTSKPKQNCYNCWSCAYVSCDVHRREG
jgi:hypothetical protein